MSYARIASLALTVSCSLPSCLLANELTVSIEDIDGPGVVMLEVFSNEAQFKGEEPSVMAVRQQVSTGRFNVSVAGLPDGEYGIRLMYDLNGNGELDTNVVGLPTEPWAFSNNATGMFGAPKWDDVKFTVESDTRQHINLNR